MEPKSATKLIAIAGGKGGVGKTVCTANLAMGVARHHRTLAVDMDLGCGNLNACLGVRLPQHNINEFLADSSIPLSRVKLKTPLDSLELISCSYQGAKAISLDSEKRQRLLNSLRDGVVEYAFLDLGAGISTDILDLFAAADMKIVVTSPESLALHNAFVFMKSVVYRALQMEFEGGYFTPPVRQKMFELLNSDPEMDIPRIIEKFRAWSRYAAYIVQGLLSDLKVHVIFNMVDGSGDMRYEKNLYRLARKYLQVDLISLGFVPYDRRVKASVNKIVPLLLEYRRSAAAKAFEKISASIEDTFSGN